jgi:hypothetical protein
VATHNSGSNVQAYAKTAFETFLAQYGMDSSTTHLVKRWKTGGGNRLPMALVFFVRRDNLNILGQSREFGLEHLYGVFNNDGPPRTAGHATK